MVEALGRSIRDLQQDDRWVGVNVATGVKKMTHLQFVDDTILFGSACRREARTIKSCLDDYCLDFGQKINWHKSEVFFVNTLLNLQVVLSRILNLRVTNFPRKFLGTPLFIGSNRSHYWKHLIDKCKSKLASWKDDKGKFPLIAWKKICQPKKAGSAGIRQILVMNLAMGAKLVWEIYSGRKQKWVRLLKHKYLDSLEPKRILTINNPPKGLAIWNFIMDSGEIISDQVNWDVRNGKHASFWFDYWSGEAALCHNPSLQPIMVETCRLWEHNICDYGY
ncbi:uncharacterized protein LOC131858469 [Cryptomeria japonica]|uniref:uncharacterized protein LOC131858469 n=1 Tax=Cryptomeria japonica TaxID=3369 RepID=UPI0027DA133B|nr:uncharacterized protein LOC131858469 [Cryptomeria japonica]